MHLREHRRVARGLNGFGQSITRDARTVHEFACIKGNSFIFIAFDVLVIRAFKCDGIVFDRVATR